MLVYFSTMLCGFLILFNVESKNVDSGDDSSDSASESSNSDSATTLDDGIAPFADIAASHKGSSL